MLDLSQPPEAREELTVPSGMAFEGGRFIITTPLAAKDRLIVDLDQKEEADALALIDALGDEVTFYGLGRRRLCTQGECLLELTQRGKKLLFSLDFLENPEVVARATPEFFKLGVTFAIVFGSGGIIDAARAAADKIGGNLKILASTHLGKTNRSGTEKRYDTKAFGDYYVDLARIFMRRGCDGVVIWPREVKRARQELIFLDAPLIVTRILRHPGNTMDDHGVMDSPRQAIADGADYVMAGDYIFDAPDPRDAVLRTIEDIQKGLDERA